VVLKKMFLTGGSGTLGTEILKIQHNYNIECIAPTSKECDVRKYDSVLEHVIQSKCDIIVHCAAITDVKEIEMDAAIACDVNVLGTLNIIRVCQKLNKKLVFISTDYVFDGEKGDYRITDPINPVSKYAKTKAAAELLVRAFDNHLVIRTSFFGYDFPYTKAVADQFSTKDYVDVIAPLVISAITNEVFGVVHIGTTKSSTYEKGMQRNPNVEKIYLKDLDFKIPKDVSLFMKEKI
jgi:dTDP-4-dehydrorhamnose reductase